MCMQVQDGFLSIAMEANTSLVQTTLKEVRDAITEELFGLEWEDSNEVMMTKVTMTLQVRHAVVCYLVHQACSSFTFRACRGFSNTFPSTTFI